MVSTPPSPLSVVIAVAADEDIVQRVPRQRVVASATDCILHPMRHVSMPISMPVACERLRLTVTFVVIAEAS